VIKRPTRHPGTGAACQEACGAAATVVPARRQARRHDGGRYAHAKQFNRYHWQLQLRRTRVGRLIRDIGRKIAGHADLEAAFAWPLACANQIRSQQQRQRGWKLYSFHAAEVECIGKGKASGKVMALGCTVVST
jgi:hypothetical protein